MQSTLFFWPPFQNFADHWFKKICAIWKSRHSNSITQAVKHLGVTQIDTGHKDCHSVFFSLSLTHFGRMFSGGLGNSVFWDAYRNQSVYSNQVVGFLWAAGLWGTLDFGETLGEIELMYLLDSFIYIFTSWEITGR